MGTTLEQTVADTLFRLDDDDARIWTRTEIKRHLQDGYDTFCRRTKCLFDIHVIENLSATGNYGSDVERYLSSQVSGRFISGKMHFTGDNDKDFISQPGMLPGAVGPVPQTGPGDRAYLTAQGITKVCHGGVLPDGTVDVLRVTYDDRPLEPKFSNELHELEARYETRSGDPAYWTMDKDGLLNLRVIPAPAGDASYEAVTGTWGMVRSETSFTGTVTGTWGILREDTEAFPSGGPWGIPRRLHPDALNIKVEIARLGKTLDGNVLELPRNYVKYVVFWAMSQALKREGQGQDLKLAKHYMERFELGLVRMQKRKQRIQKEHTVQLGRSDGPDMRFGGLGDPTAGWQYGRPGGAVRGGY